MNRIITLFLALLVSSQLVAADLKAEGDSAYAHGEYQKAIRCYESLLRQGENADVYYNLGNAYYRTENITRAVINYERAARLSPGDADIRFNLSMARSRTTDKIVPESEMFFVTWYRSLVNFTSVRGWAVVSVVAFVLTIVLLLLYLFNGVVAVRKLGFFGASIMLLCFLLSVLFARQQQQMLVRRTAAIVVAPAATVKSTPAHNGTDLFILHEGTKVKIIDDTMVQWKEVSLADGKKGWIETSQIETI